MKKKIAIIGIVSLFLLSSCATMVEFPIEVFQPAKVELPPDVKNIALVSRNLKYDNDTLQNYYSKDGKLRKDIRPVNIDSIAIKACFDSLSDRMKDLSRFSKISILPVSSFPKQYSKNLFPPSKNLIQKISSETKADALILLDMFSGFYSIYPVSENGRSVAQVVTASVWTIYDPDKYRIFHHTKLIDTVYWDGLDEEENYLASRIPNKKAAIEIAAGMAGVKYSKNIIPYWSPVKRFILSNNHSDFQKAVRMAKKNQWEEAVALWEKYTKSSNRKQQLQALYNLALASEMNGDIDNANQLISKASAIHSSPFYRTENQTIRNYAATLAKRKVELNKINSMNYEE